MSLMDLVSYGAQDIYLSDNVKITFFKIIYNRFSNFDVRKFEAATIIIQNAWRLHVTCKAVSIIEKHVLDYLYRPGGRLAPVCFSQFTPHY